MAYPVGGNTVRFLKLGPKHRGGWSPPAGYRTDDEWYTPRWLIDRLGRFDMDPCPAGGNRTDGLRRRWRGRVWCNPPYSKAEPWVRKMAGHGNGIVLVGMWPDTLWFQDYILYAGSDAVLWLLGRRVKFERWDGRVTSSPPFGLVLAAYGEGNVRALRDSGLSGSLTLTKDVRWVGPGRSSINGRGR